jgi:hypothetical protein
MISQNILNLAESPFVLPIHFMFIKSSIAHNNHTIHKVKRLRYVSSLENNELLIISNHCKNILKITIKKTAHKITPAHIVGVPALLLCNLKNSVAFHQINHSSLICFQSLNSFSIFI